MFPELPEAISHNPLIRGTFWLDDVQLAAIPTVH
jgi:hypothetical protein